MERFIQVILFCTFISSLLAFNCNSVSDSASCAQMTGCTWTDPTCGGTFAPACTTTLCYYIDPVGGVDTNAGAALTPYRTLTAGFQKLAGKTGTATLIVLNYNIDTQAEIFNYTTVTTAITMTINRQFNSSQYVINMQNFDLTTIPAGSNMSVYITAGKVEIVGAMINNNTVKTGVSTVFELGNAKLFLRDTGIQDYKGSALLVNSGPTMTTAQFNYTGGRYANSSFAFRLQNGATTTGTQHVFKEIRFFDASATDYLIYALPLVEITNVFIKRGTPTIYKASTPQVTITNVTMKDYTGTFVDVDTINKFTLINSVFQNIAPNSSVPFVRLTNAGASLSGTHTITNLTFQNVSVKHSVFLLEKGYQRAVLDLIVMDNITKMSTAESPTLLDLEYESEWPGGLCMLGRKGAGYTVNRSSFTNIGSHCIGLKTTALTMFNNVFNNTALDYTEVAVSEDKMDESMGVTWLYVSGGTTDVTPGTLLKISTCKFYDNKIRPLYGGAIRFTGSFASGPLISDCEFFYNKAFYGGAIYSDNPLVQASISTTVFYQNQAKQDGGAIWKISDTSANLKSPLLALATVNFTENSAIGKGGAIYQNYDSMRVDTSTFTRNTAQNGGAIYHIKLHPVQLNPYLKNCTFDSNYASNAGHAMKLLFKYELMGDNAASPVIYINNTESDGKNVSDGRPSYYMFYFYNITTNKEPKTVDDYKTWINDTNLTSLVQTINSSAIPSDFKLDHKSGSSLSDIVLVKVFDDYDKPVTSINKETLNLEITATQNNKSDFEAFIAGNIATFTFEAGQYLMKSTVKIVGEPTTTATLTFTGSEDTSTLLNDAGSLIDMSWTVNFVNCEVGDIYNPLTKKCDTCPEGSYSLVDPYSNTVCVECDDEKATCPGGDKIAPRPGYWRFSHNSDNVLECPEKDACEGGLKGENYTASGTCAKPYSGNMCNTCDEGFAKFGDSATCVNCTTDTMYYVKFTGYFLIQLIALLYGVKCNVAKMSNVKKAHLEDNKELKDKLKNEDFQSNLMKIAVNFLQVSAIVIQYKFEWPKFILEFVGTTNKIFPTQKEGFSMDCLITLITKENSYTYFIKLVITLVQPFVLWVILIMFYALYLKIKRQPIKNNSNFKKDLLVLFIITAFILQPTVMQAALQMFKCQNINTTSDPQYYMVDDSATECWTAFHFLWSVGIALPNFLLWAIVLPGVLLRMLIKRAKDLKNPEIYAKFSFVYEGLKTDKFYWEFVVLLRKMLVVLIFVFFNFISVQSQAFATFLVVIGFGCVHYVFWPYNDERLNRAEMVALISLGVMVYCGMFFLSNGGNEWLYTVLIVVSLIFNVFFFVYLAVLFIKSYKKTAARMTKKISEAIEKRKTARSGSKSNNSSILSTEKKNTVVDIQDLSLVLGKVQINNDDYPNSPTPMMPQISEGLRLADHERNGEEDDSAIPSELNVHRWTSGKTVFNEEKVDVDNYSVLRSSVRRSEVRTNGRRNSGNTVVTPDINLQDVIHLYNIQRSSLANSNDQKYLGRSFSLFEKTEGPLQKEGQQEQEQDQEQEDQVNEDRPEEQVEEAVLKKIKEDTEEKPEPEENEDNENKRRSNNSDDNNQE